MGQVFVIDKFVYQKNGTYQYNFKKSLVLKKGTLYKLKSVTVSSFAFINHSECIDIWIHLEPKPAIPVCWINQYLEPNRSNHLVTSYKELTKDTECSHIVCSFTDEMGKTLNIKDDNLFIEFEIIPSHWWEWFYFWRNV